MRTLAEINQQAIALLYRELGIRDAVRFLMQFTPGYGDYTQERQKLFADLTLEEIVAAIQQAERERPNIELPRSQSKKSGISY